MSVQQTIRSTPARQAWALMSALLQEQRGTLMRAAREFELSPPQLFTLRHLRDVEGLPMGELAAFLHCDSSNVTGIVDRLEQRGLVERRAADHDRRVRKLVLTDAGGAIADELDRRMGTPPAALLALPAADQRALRDLLRRALELQQP